MAVPDRNVLFEALSTPGYAIEAADGVHRRPGFSGGRLVFYIRRLAHSWA